MHLPAVKQTYFKLSWDTQTVCWVNDWRSWKSIEPKWPERPRSECFHFSLYSIVSRPPVSMFILSWNKRKSFRRYTEFKMFTWVVLQGFCSSKSQIITCRLESLLKLVNIFKKNVSLCVSDDRWHKINRNYRLQQVVTVLGWQNLTKHFCRLDSGFSVHSICSE